MILYSLISIGCHIGQRQNCVHMTKPTFCSYIFVVLCGEIRSERDYKFGSNLFCGCPILDLSTYSDDNHRFLLFFPDSFPVSCPCTLPKKPFCGRRLFDKYPRLWLRLASEMSRKIWKIWKKKRLRKKKIPCHLCLTTSPWQHINAVTSPRATILCAKLPFHLAKESIHVKPFHKEMLIYLSTEVYPW